MTLATRPRAARLVVLVAAIGLFGAACGPTGLPADPPDALGAALESTFSNDYAFDFHVDVKEGALEPSGGGGGGGGGTPPQMNTLIKTLRISGRVAPAEEAGTGSLALTIAAMGSDFVEIVSINDGDEPALSLRVDLSPLAAMIGEIPTPEEIIEEMQLQEAPAQIQELVTALVEGKWVTMTGTFDPAAFSPEGMEVPSIEPSEAASIVQEAFGGDFAAAVADFAVVTERDDAPEGTRAFDIALKVRALINAFARIAERVGGEEIPEADIEAAISEAPETIGGLSVTTEGSVVTRIALDVGEAARSADPEADVDVAPGDAVVVLALSDHGEIAAIEAPEAAATITVDELTQVFKDLSAGMGGMPGGGDDSSPDSG